MHVVDGDAIVGSTILEDWDRSMGVAGGAFQPTKAYRPDMHARLLQGVEKPLSVNLRVVVEGGNEVECELAVIIDWAETAGAIHGRELNVYGLDAESFFGPETDEP